MRSALIWTVGLTTIASMAEAGLPTLNATCPTGIEVHADEGGPVYINGNEAAVTGSNDSYYEAKQGSVTISISINPDGSADVSYTGSGGANGICQVSASAAGQAADCPVDVSEADRANYPGCN